jgi:urea transport system substrate-binding protein
LQSPTAAETADSSSSLADSVLIPPTQLNAAADTSTDGARGDERARFAFLAEARGPDELGWLGPYRIRGVLGEGGMGVVFDAEDSQLRRRVALKILKPELALTPVLRERFLQEARAAAALPADHVVAIYHVDVEGDIPFLAMEYLPGESLEERLHRVGRLPEAELAPIGRDIARGLAVAHEKGLIHRDIKPANIWLETVPGAAAPRVKLLDFGLARLTGDVRNLTASGMIVGTPHYLAPEQARGLELDARCDLFSLGCVLYRALTGVLPFDGSDMLAMLSSLALDAPPPIRDLAPEATAEMVDLIDRLLSKSPGQRPATAREVAARLHALDGMSIPPPPAPVLDAIPKPERRKGKGTGAGGGRTGRFGLGLLLGGVLAWMILILGAWSWLKTSTRPVNVDCSLQGHPIPVGVLQSLSGPLASASAPITEATQLAIDEINQQGGVLGSRVEPVLVDGSSDESAFAEQANRLILENHICALFGCCSPAGRKRVQTVVEKHDNLLFYPLPCEGLEESPNIVYVGAAPNQQILPVMQFALGTLGKRRLFLVGSDHVYSRTVHAMLRDALAERPDVRIVDEELFPLGGGDVQTAAAKITAGEADLILNTMSGDTNLAFFRALRAAGVTPEKTPTLSFTVGENELRALPIEQRIGDYAAWNYFQSVSRPENTAFVHKFRARFGAHRVVTDPMESAYVAVHLWARAATKADDTRPAAVRQALKGLRFNAPGGPVRIDAANQYTWKVVRLGRIGDGGQFKLVWSSEEPVPPEPFPPTRKRAEWLRFLDEMHRDLGGRWGR